MEIVVDGRKCLIDDEDLKWISLLNLRIKKHSSAKLFYVFADGIPLHKLVFIQKHERIIPGNVIDHINRNTLDNRKVNLRQLSSSDNYYKNKSKRSGSSRYIGVKKVGGVWKAYYKDTFIGNYLSEIDAAKAYDLHTSVYSSNALRLNFPEDYLPLHILLRKVNEQRRD